MTNFVTKALLFSGLAAGTFAFVGIAANVKTIDKAAEGLSQEDQKAVFAFFVQTKDSGSCEALQTAPSRTACKVAMSNLKEQNRLDTHLIPRVFKAAFN